MDVDEQALAAAGGREPGASMTPTDTALPDGLEQLNAVVFAVGYEYPSLAVDSDTKRMVELTNILSQFTERTNVPGRGRTKGEQSGVAAAQ